LKGIGNRVARAALASVSVFLVVAAGTAAAHPGARRTMVLLPTESGLDLVVEEDATAVGTALGLGAAPGLDALRARPELVTALLVSDLTVRSDGGRCRPEAGPPAMTARDGAESVVLEVAYACSSVAGLRLEQEDGDHGETLVTVVRGGRRDATVLGEGRRSIDLAPEAPGLLETAGAFLVEGGVHLVTGYDHVLFLLSLVLGAGMLVRKQGVKPALRDAATVVTAFTVGHSVTLVAAALDWVTLPSRPVEIAIAASIVIAAAINIARPEAERARPALALVFGLIHGFGFSSVLSELGLPASDRVVALLSFNVGIELAQLALCALALVPLAWLATRKGYRLLVVQGGSALIALCGGAWLVERAFGP
jgi:hypothetical protein